MDEQIIEKLFEEVSSHFDIVPEEVKRFFSIFVRETLAYRDELVASGEKPLVVQEVQEALNLLEVVISTEKLPRKGVPPRTYALLKRWISRLNE